MLGNQAGFAILYEIMGFTDQTFDNHFRREATVSTDHMNPIQMFKIERWVRTSDILTEELKRDLLEEHIHPWWERYEPTSVYHYQDSPTTKIISEILALWGDATGEVLSVHDLDIMIQQLLSTVDTDNYFSEYTTPSGRYEFPNDATWNNNFKKFIKETFINSEENEKLFEDKKKMTLPEIERRAEGIIARIDRYIALRKYYKGLFGIQNIEVTSRWKHCGTYAHNIIQEHLLQYLIKQREEGNRIGELTVGLERYGGYVKNLAFQGENIKKENRKKRVDFAMKRDKIYKQLYESEQWRDSLERENGFVPELADEVEYVAVDFTTSTVFGKNIRRKLEKGYFGRNRHLLIVIYGPKTAEDGFQGNLKDLREDANKFLEDKEYGDRVDIITLEQFARTYKFQCFFEKTHDGKTFIEGLNTRIATAVNRGGYYNTLTSVDMFLELAAESWGKRKLWQKYILRLNHIPLDKFLGNR